MRYAVAIDQSTQGTKALLFDERGAMIARADVPHPQLVSREGWVSHAPMDLYRNTVAAVCQLVGLSGISRGDVAAVGISNQRETSLLWDRETGKPLNDAVVWHCARAKDICERPDILREAERIRESTGLPLSPYFSAAKWAWLLENIETAKGAVRAGRACLGTVDSWLLFKLTGAFRTDVSNAARTQLFNIRTLAWDEALCALFGIPVGALPEVCPSDALFGKTDFEGFFVAPVPVHAVMGDSNCALFGQGCREAGQVKATYGTGSSVMMNTGPAARQSTKGLATSIAWGMNGEIAYVLEGNVNHSGSVITWLKDRAGLIEDPGETQRLAESANQDDQTVLVPAFTGLGAPHWDSGAKALIAGMSFSTGKAELVKAGLESIAYQIEDVLGAMQGDTGIPVTELRVDGGATKNGYLMQFQSDLSGVPVRRALAGELSGIGAAYAAGLAQGLYSEETLSVGIESRLYAPRRDETWRAGKKRLWRDAIRLSMERT